jgi:hypothetical protein
MKFIYNVVLYITSWIIRIGIRLRWWNLIRKVLKYKLNKLAIRMRPIKQ